MSSSTNSNMPSSSDTNMIPPAGSSKSSNNLSRSTKYTSNLSSSSSTTATARSISRNSLSMSVSTRSMSRMALATPSSSSSSMTREGSLARSKLMRLEQVTGRKLSSTTTSRRGTRISPRNSVVLGSSGHDNVSGSNDEGLEKGKTKRKSDELDMTRPRKVVRLEDQRGGRSNENKEDHNVKEEGISMSRISVKQEILDSRMTPPRASGGLPKLMPTPARELLRFGMKIPIDNDDKEEEEDEHKEMIPRPPTPPRAHANPHSMEVDTTSKDNYIQLQNTKPAEQLPPITPSKHPMPITIDSTTPEGLPRSFTGPRTPPSSHRFGGLSRLPLSPHAAHRFHVPSSISTVSNTTEQVGVSRLAVPSVGITPKSPGRFGGISRFGAAPSPAAKRYIPVVPQPTKRLEADMASGPAIPAAETQMAIDPSNYITDKPVQPLLSTSANKDQEESMDVDMSPPKSTIPAIAPPISKPTSIPTGLSRTNNTKSLSSTMGPPSRIPTMKSSRAMQPLTVPKVSSIQPIVEEEVKPAPVPAQAASQIKKSYGPVSGGLPERRPSTRPNMTAITASSSGSTPAAAVATQVQSQPQAQAQPPIRRKPSYPSSLGHGPPRRETPRMVSVPVPSHIIESSLPSDPITDHLDSLTGQVSFPPKSPRSVSNPEVRDRLSLSMSSRREGWMDTSRSLAGLSDALEKLKVKKAVPSSSNSEFGTSSKSNMISSIATTANTQIPVLAEIKANPNINSIIPGGRLSAVHKPRQSGVTGVGVGVGDTSVGLDMGDKSLAALMCSASGGGCLKGVVAFVDVWTSDGTDSGGVFVDMLRGLGARVLGRPTESCTHIIYKSGRPSTLTWYRKQQDPPHIVGISWVTKSKEAGKRLGEEKFLVQVEEEDVFQKRRKSMEPKQLSLMNSLGSGRPSLLSVNEARRRSMVYAPKVSSPLKKTHRLGEDDDDY